MALNHMSRVCYCSCSQQDDTGAIHGFVTGGKEELATLDLGMYVCTWYA